LLSAWGGSRSGMIVERAGHARIRIDAITSNSTSMIGNAG
jgi:hypothetical protein